MPRDQQPAGGGASGGADSGGGAGSGAGSGAGNGSDGSAGGAGADRGVLRFLTCGSVDDGKSTLIGRLLYDTKTLLSDTLATLEANAVRRGRSAVDLSLLTDGLVAEREQGITIDVAYRYFATARRKFIIADAPGHEQYTRNMVTAASTADVAVLLIDARKGILPQTRRHATLATLLGIRHLILAVNKMDLVGFDRAVFDRITAEFRAWLAQHGDLATVEVQAIALSALDGDMVVERGARLAWYTGPTLVQLLEEAPGTQQDAAAPLRLPVQWVCRPAQVDARAHGHEDFRAYAGRVAAGTLSVGDEIVVLPGGARSRISGIAIGDAPLQHAFAGQSVMVRLADERDISRGDMLVRAAQDLPLPRQQFAAVLCWLSAAPLQPARSYLLQHATRAVKSRVTAVCDRLDLHALAWLPAAPGAGAAGTAAEARGADGADGAGGAGGAVVALNDIVRVQMKTQQPLVADAYAASRTTGSFILIDEATNDTVAAGMIEPQADA